MKLFDFDKFSRSAWVGARHNVAWKKYDVVTTDDSANAAVEAHRFLQRSHDKGEQCLCGWAGDCWADHFEDQVVPKPEEVPAESPDPLVVAFPEEEAPKPKRRRKKADEESEAPIEPESVPEVVEEAE